MRADRGPARGAPSDALGETLGARGGGPLGNASADALGAPLDGAVAALRGAPAASAGALARATAAALAAQAEAGGSPAAAWRDRPAGRPWRAWAGARAGWRAAALAAGVAAAVGLGTWTLRGGRGADPAPAVAAGAPAPVPAPAAPAPAALTATPAALRALDEVPRLVRFRLRAPGARAVAVVGDFNRWDRAATPLAAAGDEWTADVPLAPGRHAYAFVVDGRRRVLDPAAPAERDPDFGGAHSVTVVGVAGAP